MFVGRGPQRSELSRLLADDHPVVIAGEAGIGKTALLRAVAADSGRPIFEGGALSTLSWLEYLPLERALGRPVRGADVEAVALEVVAAVGDGVLLLDDLQWADSATLAVTELVATRVGVLAAVRRGAATADAVLDRLRAAGFGAVTLGPLDESDATTVVTTLHPDLSPPLVARVVARTGGNPLLLRELTASGEPTDSLRLAIEARLRGLDAIGADTFAMIALAGRPLPVDAVGEAGIKSLLGADLVVVSDDGTVAARHALLAEVFVDQLEPHRLRELHGRIARGLADDGEAARHFALAGETATAYSAALRAVAASRRPGERAAHLAVAAACAGGPEADELRLEAARALETAHDWDAMVPILAAVDPANREGQAWACLLRARSLWTAGDADGLARALDEGLALVDGTGSEIEVRLRIEHGRVPVFVRPDLEAGVAETAEALELARERCIDVPRAEYLHGTALAVADRDSAWDHLESAITGARDAGDTSTEFLAANNLISFHESGGDPTRARRLCLDAISRANELGLGAWESAFRAVLLALQFHAGEYDQVLAEAEALLDVEREARARDNLIETWCLALVDTGRIDEALRRMDAARDRFSDDYRGTLQVEWVYAEAALWGGRPASALEHVDRVISAPEVDPNRNFLYVTRGWALTDLGRDPDEPAPEHPRPMLAAAHIESLGLRALFEGDPGAAADRFTAAAEVYAPYHRRGELRCRWAAGEALRRVGGSAAIGPLEAVERQVVAHGMRPLLARVHRSLRACGVRRSAPRTRAPGELLSGRQHELLRLVGDGLTNAEIAHRLGISRHTVVTQISSAATKLGATGRRHAAALVAGRME